MEIAGDIFGVADRAFSQLPDVQQPRDRWDLITPGFVHHLEMTDERQPDDHADDTDPRFGADGRLAWCDERGIDVQFLNPTFLVGPIIQVARLGRFDLIHEVQSTWNRWAMEVVDGHADRLIPATQIDLHDIDWSLGEMERMREAGSRAFMIPEAPVSGRGRAADGSRAVGRSISHLDFDPIWSAAEDLGMAAFAHVGFGRERINAGWANNGADDLLTFNALNMLVGSRIAPQLLLGSFVSGRGSRAASRSRGRRGGARHRLAPTLGHHPGGDGGPNPGDPPRRRLPARQPGAGGLPAPPHTH